MSFLTIEHVEFRRGKHLILPTLSFTIAAEQFACLLGPSGSGKTTLLRLIAGLEKMQHGRIMLGEKVLSSSEKTVSPDARNIGMVFQQPTLFPTKTVAENIRFGMVKNAGQDRLTELLAHIGLREKANAYPHELSGGQQHRVALARALAPSPKWLLLDEPFAHLDPERRVRLREETKELVAREGVGCLMVTHDAEEAMQTADVIVLMDESGAIRQQGTPHDVFHFPVDRYAAQALGDVNVIPAYSDGRQVCSILGKVETRSNLRGDVMLAVRPQGIVVEDGCHENCATIERVNCTGPEDLLTVKTHNGVYLKVRLPHTHHWRLGDRVSLSVRSDYMSVFAREVHTDAV